MVTFEKHRSAILRATEFIPVCSECDWRNSGNPALTITDAAVECAIDGAIDGIVSEHLSKARAHHKCKAGEL